MKFTTIILFFSFVLGQSNDLPFDWSGQFGMSSINGRLFWNTDWTSGPLLFDGTFPIIRSDTEKTSLTNFHLSLFTRYLSLITLTRIQRT
jgi:hypothetical protein